MSKENNNLMSDIPENERTADETGHGFDINAWRALPFLRKIETADKPLKWLVVMPSLLALYGCLFYVIANSCVYYPEIVPVRAFLFQDVFMLVLLVLMALDVLVALGRMHVFVPVQTDGNKVRLSRICDPRVGACVLDCLHADRMEELLWLGAGGVFAAPGFFGAGVPMERAVLYKAKAPVPLSHSTF